MPNSFVVTGQDFDNVVFHDRFKKQEPLRSNTQDRSHKHIEDDIPKAKVSHKQKLSLAQYRQAGGYKNQKALSTATNGKISVGRIAELENGKGNAPSGLEKQILFRLLKMKF